MTHDPHIHTDADLDTAVDVWAWSCRCGAGETGLTAGQADDAAAAHGWEHQTTKEKP